ncbi:MAG: endonuclease/exonuclease/phosphatase family protein [Myxococcota bacterium]|nr:endonuclease/exonuclease/phosphatase family protein [Deltaproteobacteria bacterium]MDQ3333786.1 endonuclease/exonuclease/phosphatase family protein [Myxococcota bacterium]
MLRRDFWRVVTLNIWNRSGPWTDRLKLIRDGLRALEPDVIGLQEVLAFGQLPSQAHEIAEGTGWNVFYAPAWAVGGDLTMGNAILSPHNLFDKQVLALPTEPGLDSRSVAFARVDAPHGPMPCFVTHFTYQLHLGHVRCLQARVLADHVAQLAPIDDPPPVILGDLNAQPDADEIRFLRGATALGGRSVFFFDCWQLNGGDVGYTYDRKNPYALRSHEPSARFDYVFVRGPDRVSRGEPISTRLALNEPVDGVWPSDHFAVVADLYAAPRAAQY